MLPVLFPAEVGAPTSASPVRDGASVAAAEAGDSQGPLLLRAWGAERGEAAPPPAAGAKIVDRAAADGKVGALVKASPGKPRGRDKERDIERDR